MFLAYRSVRGGRSGGIGMSTADGDDRCQYSAGETVRLVSARHHYSKDVTAIELPLASAQERAAGGRLQDVGSPKDVA